MRVYKCDRCGRIFSEKLDPIKKSALSGANSAPIDLFTRDINMVDLCENCISDFIFWWKEPALAGITNEEKL